MSETAPKPVHPEAYDVIVCGAGPGGSACAAFLARQGHRVLLLDKARFPRDKICGDAVSGKSMAVVRDLGIARQVEQSPHAKVYGVVFSSPKGTVVRIPFVPEKKRQQGRYRDYGYVCRREVFDHIVFQAAKKNVTRAIEGFTVTGVVWDGERVAGVEGRNAATGKKETYHARVVVGADGATSAIARAVGVYEVDPRHWLVAIRAYYDGIQGLSQDIEIHFLDSVMPGYFWIFPVEDGKANVGLGMVMEDMKKKNINLAAALHDAVHNHRLFKERFKNARPLGPVRGWNLPVGSKRRTLHGNGWVLVGDAASLIDPFSGEGIGNAMTSGKLAAECIHQALQAGDTSAAFLKAYEDRLWAEIGPELQTSYAMQRLGKIQFLLNLLIDKAARSQEFREHISGMLANEQAKKELVSPLFYLKLLLPW